MIRIIQHYHSFKGHIPWEMVGDWFLQLRGEEHELYITPNGTMKTSDGKTAIVSPSAEQYFPATEGWHMVDFPEWDDGYSHWNFLRYE